MAAIDSLRNLKDLRPKALAGVAAKHYSALMPMFAMSLILVMLIPLPPSLMDLFLAGNMTLAAVVLMTVMYMHGPLEFTAFPSLLLAMTLFRLVLNTATTRLILTNAQAGPSAAGHVIETFGEFVAGGSLIVGVVIFAIIVVIQFVVITKGATRIAEVAARFTLDGMPGKQMAIDADLNAGIISEPDARKRRDEITQESDFYGAMDGASKFVRGDAIAGLVITFINILGGIYVGMVESGMGLMETLKVFTTLTIGDGLVSQIPAFMVSIASALIVTRSAAKKNLGEELIGQLTQQPAALVLSGGFLLVLAMTPLPKVPLLGLAASVLTIAYVLNRTRTETAVATEAAAKSEKSKAVERPEQLILPEPMELEVGYGLIRLIDRKQGGDLLDRITNMRRQIAQELGIVVPPVRIRDNMRLQPNEYAIKIRGNQVATGELMPGQVLAIDSGTVSEKLHGMESTEPAFGLPALWIDAEMKSTAEQRNYTVVEPSSVLSTHLTETIKRHADEILTRNEMNRLLDTVRERSPKLIEELIPQVIKPGEVQKVLQLLLRERVPIRDLEAVLETLGDWAPRTKDADVLVEYARASLSRTICEMHRSGSGSIRCITLEPTLEETITSHLETTERGTFWAMPPQLQKRIVEALRGEVERVMPMTDGQAPVVLCAPRIRLWVRRMIESTMPHVPVLSYNEIVRGVEIETRGMVVLNHES
jgi:flagellar biosynthesis protein FlhA